MTVEPTRILIVWENGFTDTQGVVWRILESHKFYAACRGMYVEYSLLGQSLKYDPSDPMKALTPLAKSILRDWPDHQYLLFVLRKTTAYDREGYFFSALQYGIASFLGKIVYNPVELCSKMWVINHELFHMDLFTISPELSMRLDDIPRDDTVSYRELWFQRLPE